MDLDGRTHLLLVAVLVSAIGASLVMLTLPAPVNGEAATAEEEISSRDAAIPPVRAVRVIVASPYHR